MKILSGFEDKRARVEMLPLIDVVFLLLVFFIYAMLSMVVHHGVEVQLPQAGSAVVDTREHVLVTIDAENRTFVNGKPVAREGLAGAVRDALTDAPDAPVFLDGDTTVELGEWLAVLDLLRQAGIKEASIRCTPPR
jgi:biopolymer transport protein ExbD